jgi:hypothetical protein
MARPTACLGELGPLEAFATITMASSISPTPQSPMVVIPRDAQQ